MTEQQTPVFLTEEEAKRFVSFHKYYLLIGALESINALDVKSGYVQINFDALGRIQSVDKHEHHKI